MALPIGPSWRHSGPLPRDGALEGGRAGARRHLRLLPVAVPTTMAASYACWLRPWRDPRPQHGTSGPDMIGRPHRYGGRAGPPRRGRTRAVGGHKLRHGLAYARMWETTIQDKLGKKIDRVPAPVMDTLSAYAWPGNIRELANVLERAIILSPGSTLVLHDVLGTTPRPDLPAAPAIASRVWSAPISWLSSTPVSGASRAQDRPPPAWVSRRAHCDRA